MDSMDSCSPIDLMTNDMKKIDFKQLFVLYSQRIFILLWKQKCPTFWFFILKISTYYHFKHSSCYSHEIYSIVVLTAAIFEQAGVKETIYSRTTHIKRKPTAAVTGECVSSETDNAHGYNCQDKHKQYITNKILGIL